MLNAIGPLDPDPFVAGTARTLEWNWTYGLTPSPHLFPYVVDVTYPSSLFAPVESTLATVAFIPEGDLPAPFKWLFLEDGVNAQPEWLSSVFIQNRFRLAHGVRLEVYANAQHGFLPIPPRGFILGKTNPTILRRVRKSYDAPIQEAHYPAARVMPPPGRNVRGGRQHLIAVASNMRAMNGFFATAAGRGLSAVGKSAYRALGKTSSRAAPQIGSTIQLWIAADGCKCFAFAHNWFPKYNFFVDGVRITWDSPKDFGRFDGFDIDVDWQPFVAFLLIEVLRPYPIYDRYPGAVAVGWYRWVSPRGIWNWCDEAPRPHVIQFPRRPSDAEVVRWWQNLENYVMHVSRLFLERADEPISEWWPRAVERLAERWRAANLGQQDWLVWRLRE